MWSLRWDYKLFVVSLFLNIASHNFALQFCVCLLWRVVKMTIIISSLVGGKFPNWCDAHIHMYTSGCLVETMWNAIELLLLYHKGIANYSWIVLIGLVGPQECTPTPYYYTKKHPQIQCWWMTSVEWYFQYCFWEMGKNSILQWTGHNINIKTGINIHILIME